MSLTGTSSTAISMEAGLEALNQGQDQEAIHIFEIFCQNAVSHSREHLQAQMHLVEIYKNLGQTEQAIALCQELLTCPNAQVQIWAQQTMKGLAPELEAAPEVAAPFSPPDKL
jgi:lipopolysaccharide biosynthesis regulator YciM